MCLECIILSKVMLTQKEKKPCVLLHAMNLANNIRIYVNKGTCMCRIACIKKEQESLSIMGYGRTECG